MHLIGHLRRLTARTVATVEVEEGGRTRTLLRLPKTSSPGTPSVLAFSLPRAGSNLLEAVLKDMSEVVGLTYISIMGEYFRQGLAERDIPASTSRVILDNGYCYGGFRYFPKKFEIPIINTRKSILLVRDPRDMLVSHYFATRDSHPLPGTFLRGRKELPKRDVARATELDDYVLQLADFYTNYIGRYATAMEKHPGALTLFRYEDIISNKRDWVKSINDTFGWDIGSAQLERIADTHDVLPAVEKARKHIRQAAPGDHVRKLRSDTVERLTTHFRKELSLFGYA